ncbi:MAG: hypothetical protein J7M13_02145 [Synergistetes bacterium]|nr:hypothetical protein [Synergistota bacterium]
MKVFIDEEERIDLEDLGIKEIVSRVEEEVKKSGRVVMKVEVDGRPVDEKKLGEMDLSGAREISFITKSVRDLVKESLGDLRLYLPKLVGGLKDIASLFRVGEFKKGLGLLPKAVEGLGWLIKVFEYTAVILGVEWSEYKEIDFDKERDELIEKMSEISSVLEDRDFIRLSDLLAYEIAPTLERWEKVADYLLSLAQQTRH